MRTGIFIDGITLFHGLEGKRFHFGDFKNWIINNDEPGYAGYFNCVENLGTKKKFFMHVLKSGFKIFIRKPKYDFEERKLDIRDMNIELTAEAMHNMSEFDKFILVSGKHDFLPLCEKLEESGKEIEIIGFKNNINSIFNKYNLRYVEDFLSEMEIDEDK